MHFCRSLVWISWWRHQMETFSCYWPFVRGIHRPVTRSFDVSFDLRLNKRLSKPSWGWWFETPKRSLWRHSNALPCLMSGCWWLSIFWYLIGTNKCTEKYWPICCEAHNICVSHSSSSKNPCVLFNNDISSRCINAAKKLLGCILSRVCV